MDFIGIVNTIFKDKETYNVVSDEDKVKQFYMINKKFAHNRLDIANFFNDKNIDKASAIDMWNIYFEKTVGLPGWYWAKSNGKIEKVKKLPKADRELILKNNDITEHELDFMIEHNLDEVETEVKKLKRFEQ